MGHPVESAKGPGPSPPKRQRSLFSWSGGVQLIFSILMYIWGPKMVIKQLESDIHGQE